VSRRPGHGPAGERAEVPPDPSAPGRPAALTRRDLALAALIARGWSNQQIAEELVLSPGSVANHVARIMKKLGFNSRAQIASWAIEHGLGATQDRLLTTLERLLAIEATTLKSALDAAAQLVGEALGADKVDVWFHDPATDTLVAVGASDTPLMDKQRATGLDRLPVANQGRIAAAHGGR
jgi:DNA-binding CsgD family transcriptional regulator